MSGYHYSDQSGTCSGDCSCGNYVALKNVSEYSCNIDCICRFMEQRSTFDQMMFQRFVDDDPRQARYANSRDK